MLKKKGVRQHFVLGGDGTQKGAPVLRLRGVSISGNGQSVWIYMPFFEGFYCGTEDKNHIYHDLYMAHTCDIMSPIPLCDIHKNFLDKSG